MEVHRSGREDTRLEIEDGECGLLISPARVLGGGVVWRLEWMDGEGREHTISVKEDEIDDFLEELRRYASDMRFKRLHSGEATA
jgi:hypothetical protein